MQRNGIRPAGATLRQVAKTCIAAGLEEPEDSVQVKLGHVQGVQPDSTCYCGTANGAPSNAGQGAETASTDVQWT
jgi:hypothetical protein